MKWNDVEEVTVLRSVSSSSARVIKSCVIKIEGAWLMKENVRELERRSWEFVLELGGWSVKVVSAAVVDKLDVVDGIL